jgi:FkbM family methyltransferase
MSGSANHHPVFNQFDCWRGDVEAGWSVNFLGVRTRDDFAAGMSSSRSAESRLVETGYPPFDEEYFEWIDVLEATLAAEGGFTMIELGAGWGRWLMVAAAAIRQTHRLPFHLVGVEAEPTHFRWMRQHFRDNSVDAGSLTLIEAAVAGTEGRVRFHVGDPSAWYGQAIDVEHPQPNRRSRRSSLLSQLRGVASRRTARDERRIVEVRALTLQSILERVDSVDLIDLDVQGVEAEVLESAKDLVSAKVKRVHVGTHSAENEQRLRSLFGSLGWESLNDYPCATEAETPWGPIRFQDGVQTWRSIDAALR